MKRNCSGRFVAGQEEWPWGGEHQQGASGDAEELRKQAADRISTLEEVLQMERSQVATLKAKLWDARGDAATLAEEMEVRKRKQGELRIRLNQVLRRELRAEQEVEDLKARLREAEDTVRKLWADAQVSTELAEDAKGRGIFLHLGSDRRQEQGDQQSISGGDK
jgi:chromosome segregation ATPase